MKSRFVRALAVCLALFLASLSIQKISADTSTAVSITSFGAATTQDFDSLVSTGASSVTPAGWGFVESGGSANTTYTAGTGSSTTGDTYSFGATGSSERAFGALRSGAVSPIFGARFTNNTGGTITSLDISYTGEEWRLGAAARTDRIDFEISTNATDLTTGAYTAVDPLDFTTPSTATTGAKDGNAAGNRTALSYTITGLSIANGASFFIRWTDFDPVGSDDGLAIDNFSLTANGIPPGDSAPTVSSTTPPNGAANVAVTSTLVFNFSEPVNTAAGAFSIQCPAGSPQTFAQSASSGSTFTLTPDSPLPYSTNCTVTTTAGQITDTDTTDPPDQMAANYVFSFTTASPVDAAPTVTSATPANAAPNVPVGSNLVINFSESVSATASAFTLQCPSGAPQGFTQTASPSSSFTLAPASPLPYSTTCTVTVTADQISDTDANDPPDHLASDFAFSFTTANPPPPVATNIIINEVDADTPSSDVAEFVELYDGGVGGTALNGLVVVFYNGGDHKSYAAFDLDGFTTDANGYFTLGNGAIAAAGVVFPGNLLQNGADAVALYAASASDFPNGTAVTTTNLRDAIVYDTDDADDATLLALLNTSQPQVNENGGGNGAAQSSQRCPNGTGGARNTSTYLPGAPTPGAANACPVPSPPSNSTIVISQLYGSGGNAGAAYQNDYVELYNRGTTPVDIGGWSLQYASATGSGWDANKQPLGGTIAPGEYYLISLGSGGTDGFPLEPANITGQINMSGTSGKIALANSFDGLVGNCPTADPHVMDLVGYGSADCREGAATAPSPSATNSIFRRGNGSTDTDSNGSDFTTDPAAPRRTAPIVELGPLVLSLDPRANGTNVPRDATIQITFTEPVDVLGAWFGITCASSGQHDTATFAGDGQTRYITPNVSFFAGEQCTVTLFQSQIHDQDTDDSGPNTDTLPANYTWSFTVASGSAPPYPSSVHLTMGNPSGAVASMGQPTNYLMEKEEYALSYNSVLGRPNWVSWHLSDEWIGTLTRVDSFRPDPAVPAEWYRVQSFDFSGSGFDRGHMVPNADRDKETSIPINQATFLMSNMLAQAPDNNQGPWAQFEGYLRTLLPADEVYIVAGGVGTGGSGSNGGLTTTLADGHVTVPASTWKVALVLPKAGGDDLSRATCASRTIAVVMPNVQGIRTDPWESFLTTVDAVEALTGYDLFSNLPEPVQRCVEAGQNGNNTKNDQSITFAELGSRTFGEADFAVSATASSGLAVTFTVSGPATISGGTVHLIGPGTVTITAAQPGNENFEPALEVVRSFAVAKGVQTIDFVAPADPTYGDAPLTVSATGGPSGNAVTFTASGACTAGGTNGTTITVVSAGSCAVTASQGGNDYYAAAPDVTRIVTIGKKAVTITAAAKSKMYGSADPALTYQITSGTLVNGDSFSGSLTRVGGEAVGTYAILRGSVALSGNYALTYVGAALTINGAFGTKAEILAQMRALRATVTDKQDRKKLDDAIERLADSLNPELWRNPPDGVRLDARRGEKAIEQEEQTVEMLEELITSKKSTLSDAVLQGFVTRITAMDRLLAVVAIGDAQAAGGNARKIQEALRKLQEGDARVADGKEHQAIEHYENAWKDAQEALKKS